MSNRIRIGVIVAQGKSEIPQLVRGFVLIDLFEQIV